MTTTRIINRHEAILSGIANIFGIVSIIAWTIISIRKIGEIIAIRDRPIHERS